MSVTQSEFENQVTSAGLEVYLTAPESFAGVQNTWYSPSANVEETGDLTSNFDYSGGSIVYTGTLPMKIVFTSTTTLSATALGTIIDFGVGKNGAVDLRSVQQSESFQAGGVKELTCQKVFEITTGDSLDFFMRQTTNPADTQISIEKAVWIATKAMVV